MTRSPKMNALSHQEWRIQELRSVRILYQRHCHKQRVINLFLVDATAGMVEQSGLART